MPNGGIVALQFKKIFEDHECTKAYQIYLSLLNHKNELHDNQYTIAKNAVESNWIECNLREAMQESISEMNAKNGQQALEILEKNQKHLAKVLALYYQRIIVNLYIFLRALLMLIIVFQI